MFYCLKKHLYLYHFKFICTHKRENEKTNAKKKKKQNGDAHCLSIDDVMKYDTK